ncbi:hypothetical protein BJX65DRAFT_302734 [Aspergillus insuetus]
MQDTQRPRQAHWRPYSAGDHSTYTPLLPAPSGEVAFEMENIPKYPESTCSRVPSLPPPYEEIDTNLLENEDVYAPQVDISHSADNERGNKKAKEEMKYNIRVWFLVAFMLLIIIGASIAENATTTTATATITNTVTVTQTAAPEHETTFDDEDHDDDGGSTTYYVVQTHSPGLLSSIWHWIFG